MDILSSEERPKIVHLAKAVEETYLEGRNLRRVGSDAQKIVLELSPKTRNSARNFDLSILCYQ